MEQDEQWTTTHRYFNMDDYWAWKVQQETTMQQEKTYQEPKAA
jgi:putative transposase